ncbi:hypothetical protein VPNG_02113 [Cytospora leucostoma]|uniref:Clr5 domain-containing protein n=1 Tax=Cytospora leucostoma TaxID=1230097 RepID=A0A423XHD5_9PEZI|nr:hypothetical protein VPNG_02113 [Cytospora leucostoma]
MIHMDHHISAVGYANANAVLPPLHTTAAAGWAGNHSHNHNHNHNHQSHPLTAPATMPSPAGTTTPASTSSLSSSSPLDVVAPPLRAGPEPTAAAPPAPLDWETYKDTIKDLYMGQNLNLNQVVERMKAYDFHATVKRQRGSKTTMKGKGSSAASAAAAAVTNSNAITGPFVSSPPGNSPTTTTTTTTRSTTTIVPYIRRTAVPHLSVSSYQIAHANDASRYVQSILSDIKGHVYSFFSRKPEWQQAPGTSLISVYNYSFYDSFRIALDSFLKNEHFNGGEILRQAFVEAEEAIQTDYSSTFYFFFVDLPDLFVHYGRHDIFVILLQHINRLTAVSLRDRIVGAGFASLHALARSTDPALMRHYIGAASGLWCDLLRELRGPSDRSTLLARRNHVRHARAPLGTDRARIRELCEDYDRLLAEVRSRWGPGHNATRHMEDVILLTQLNYGYFADGFVERNERLIEEVGRKYQLAGGEEMTRRINIAPVAPVSIESSSINREAAGYHHHHYGGGENGDKKEKTTTTTTTTFETLPLEAWDMIDRNIRSNCYHRLACYYSGREGEGGAAADEDRALACSRKAREGWKTHFWQIEVEAALVGAGRLFEADTLRRCRLESQYFKKLSVNDWSSASIKQTIVKLLFKNPTAMAAKINPKRSCASVLHKSGVSNFPLVGNTQPRTLIPNIVAAYNGMRKPSPAQTFRIQNNLHAAIASNIPVPLITAGKGQWEGLRYSLHTRHYHHYNGNKEQPATGGGGGGGTARDRVAQQEDGRVEGVGYEGTEAGGYKRGGYEGDPGDKEGHEGTQGVKMPRSGYDTTNVPMPQSRKPRPAAGTEDQPAATKEDDEGNDKGKGNGNGNGKEEKIDPLEKKKKNKEEEEEEKTADDVRMPTQDRGWTFWL